MHWSRGHVGRLQLAGADLRKGQIIVYSWSETKDGFWVTNGAFDLLDQDCPDGDLGAAVLRMLDVSLAGVRTPNLRTGPSPFAAVLDALGLRTWAGYARTVRHAGVGRDGGRITVTPTRNGGAKEGFVDLTELSVAFDQPPAEPLGTAVRAALAQSF
jgi:hypothetical protein